MPGVNMELASGLMTGRVSLLLERSNQVEWQFEKEEKEKEKEKEKEIRTSHACNHGDINKLLSPRPLARVFGISFAEFNELDRGRKLVTDG